MYEKIRRRRRRRRRRRCVGNVVWQNSGCSTQQSQDHKFIVAFQSLPATELLKTSHG
jgi:hypothetical protein